VYYNDGITVDKITAEADRTNKMRLFAASASYAGMQCCMLPVFISQTSLKTIAMSAGCLPKLSNYYVVILC